MTRSVLFDTETTGLDPAQGHRVIEIAALELDNDLPTGRHFHALVQPDRDIPEDAIRIHGITPQKLAGRPPLDRARMVDTLALAKARFSGMPNSLDALSRRFGIDLSERTSHNALLDCKLLAEVYIELTGGRQRGLSLASDAQAALPVAAYAAIVGRTPRLVVPTAAELAAHAAFVARLKDPVWLAA